MRSKLILIALSLLLAFTIITSGCLGDSTTAGPPNQFNVTFEEPTTGSVFSNLSYAGRSHAQLLYTIENASNMTALDALKIYEIKDREYELFYTLPYDSGYLSFGIDAPIEQSDPPERYQIRARNETEGVLDRINVTIRREGDGELFSW